MNEPQNETAFCNRIQLLDGESPLYALPTISGMIGNGIYVKNDANVSSVYGATKVRKLEFILWDALTKGAKNLVTVGGWGSNHVLATALYCQKFGLGLHAVLVPQPFSAKVDHTLACIRSTNAQIYPVKSDVLAPIKVWSLMSQMKKTNQSPYFVYLGGSSALGTLGTVLAAFEFLDQAKLQLTSNEFTVYSALGSGSSVAGLALGFAYSGKKNKIKAIQVTSNVVINKYILNLQLNAAAKLFVRPSSQKSLVKKAKSLIFIDRGFLGKGYGWKTPEGGKAMEIAHLDGLCLDPVYTSKVFAGLLSEKYRPEEAVYWHTHSFELT